MYFLNPPSSGKGINISKVFPSENIFTVDYGFSNPLFLRYHVRKLYDIMFRRWVSKLRRSLSEIDVVWCFEPNILSDFRGFKSRYQVLHIVDPVSPQSVGLGAHADLIVAVSNRILQQFEKIDRPKLFVNHALSAHAIRQARQISIQPSGKRDQIQVGYVGNLFRRIIDTEVISTIVAENPEVSFHFWGPIDKSNLGSDAQSLYEYLYNRPNVRFHGAIPSADILPTIAGMDLFLLCYKSLENVYDSSNSHKLLEYWATGRVVVSTYIDQYNAPEFEKFLVMSPEHQNNRLPELFKKVVSCLKEYNTEDAMRQRSAYACSNSYEANARLILEKLTGEK